MHEMEEQMLTAMAAALDIDGVPIVLIPYEGPPPTPEFFFDLMRHMVTTTGEATGCITFGTADGDAGMFPLVNLDPQSGLMLLLTMRQTELLGKVTWVTVASDAYRKTFDTPPSGIRRGDLSKMAEGGDPDVEDILIALCVAPDGPGYDLSQVYRKTEHGIEWDEVLPPPDGAHSSGPLNRMMAELVTT